jgi:von Willebrand factor type A domain
MKESAPMRRSVLVLAPLALGAGLLHASCSPDRSGFESAPDRVFTEADASVEAGTTEPQGCSASTTQIERVPVVLEFLVDESTSMNKNGKWTAAREALLATFADMQKTAEPATFVGVYLYPKNDKVKPQTLLDAAHYDRLVDAVNYGPSTGVDTPTASALASAYDIVEQFTPPSNVGLATNATKRFVVLFSDGRPSDGYDKCESLVAKKLDAQPPKSPIRTFSVGIGLFPSTDGDYDPAFMGRIAQRGGTAPAGCDPNSTDLASVCHFQITPGEGNATRQELLDAFDTIRALTASCEFSFSTNPFTDLNNVTVTITDRNGNETTIPKDEVNGWSFDDPQNPTKVVLHGNACSVSTGSPSGRVDVVIGCRMPN